MLDRAGNAQGHVNLRVHGLAGLAHLVVHADPARVDNRTGSADHAAQHVGQLLGDLDAPGGVGADAAAHVHDHVSADEVHQLLGGLLDLDQVNMDIVLAELYVNLLQHGLRGLGLVEGLGLHYAGAHGGHLGTVVRPSAAT